METTYGTPVSADPFARSRTGFQSLAEALVSRLGGIHGRRRLALMTHQPTYSQFSQSLQKSYTQMLFY
jgi:hypothetical protein